jgi:pSer/pThr/pTyr-binding forkhead associated (FHA) protein
MASLVINSGENAGKHYPLARRPLSIGRDPARDIQIADASVSRKQCLIRLRDDNYVLQPFESVNAVLVNGVEVKDEVVLSDGDSIEVGNTVLMFWAQDDPDRTNALEQRKLADRRMREEQTIKADARQGLPPNM